MEKPDYMVRTTAQLEEACAKAVSEGVLSLDTEFVWTRTYRPQLGLVQLGCRSDCRALDCLCGLDVAPLAALLSDGNCVKILHDARQDLMHLRHYTGVAPHRVFDTQVAAAFAGFPSGIGLQKLLFEALDIGLAKTETLTDWTRRPLTEAQVRYALDDVRYLPDLRDELLRRADELGTRAWLDEELLRYDEEALYGDQIPDDAWKRIRTGRIRMNGCDRAVLRELAALREELACKWNLPRNWLGEDMSLVEMSVDRNASRLRHRLRGGQGDTVRSLYAAAIDRAAKLPEELWPEDPHRHYIAEVVAAAKEAGAWLDERAEELHVAPAVIASRATVVAYVDDVGDETNPLATGWRYEAVGREMAERFGVD